VRLKRELWASLLRSALGTQFTDDDALFLEHTLLVNSAEVIAHLVVGLDATALQPATLLGGQHFDHTHRFGLYTALRLPPPKNAAEEHSCGEAVTAYIERGSDDPTLVFDHPPPKT